VLNVQDLPKNFCIGCYLPKIYWPEDDDSGDHFTEFIRAIKRCDMDEVKWCTQLIDKNLCGFDAVAVVPSGTPGKNSGIKAVAQALAKSKSIVDATSCLIRHTQIASHREGITRTVDNHLKSIRLNYPNLLYEKNVLLLDDVRTTGTSLQACQEILEKASPKSIASIALAQTCYPGDDDPIFGLYQDLKERIEECYLDQCGELTNKYEIEMQKLQYWQDEGNRALQELQCFAYGSSD